MIVKTFTGTVRKTLNGYAFIRADELDPANKPQDIFVHVSGFEGLVMLPQGTRVVFELENISGGRRKAVHVRPIENSPPKNNMVCANQNRCHGTHHQIEYRADGFSLFDDHDSNGGTAHFTGYCSLLCLLLDVWHELNHDGEKIGDQIRALKKIAEGESSSNGGAL